MKYRFAGSFNDNDRIVLHEIIDRMTPAQHRKLGCWLLMRSLGDKELFRVAKAVSKKRLRAKALA